MTRSRLRFAALMVGLGLLLGIPALLSVRPAPPEAAPPRQTAFQPIATRTEPRTAVHPLEALRAEPDPGTETVRVAAGTLQRPRAFPLHEPVTQELARITSGWPALAEAVGRLELRRIALRHGPAAAAIETASDSDVPVHVPGCVNRAKRQWAGAVAGIVERPCTGADRVAAIYIGNLQCEDPALDRGLPAMCGSGRRR